MTTDPRKPILFTDNVELYVRFDDPDYGRCGTYDEPAFYAGAVWRDGKFLVELRILAHGVEAATDQLIRHVRNLYPTKPLSKSKETS